MKTLSRRNIVGALLCLVLVGEPTVGGHSGLFTVPGLIVLLLMYYLLFLLYERLGENYRLNYRQLVLLNFALYSVLITGLFHRELADYALHPHNDLITTLIRIQCSFFPLFVYALLNRYSKRDASRVPRLSFILLAWLVFIGALSLTGKFGIPGILYTVQTAPLVSTIFITAATVSLLAVFRKSKSISVYSSPALICCSIGLAILGIIPSLLSLIGLLIAMPLAAVLFLTNTRFRHTPI